MRRYGVTNGEARQDVDVVETDRIVEDEQIMADLGFYIRVGHLDIII